MERLKLRQDEKGYHYSLDPFLLAHFMKPEGDENVADLGTGCGVIAILLAAKYQSLKVTGVEIQSQLVATAQDNVRQNGLGERVQILQGDIRNIRSLLRAQSCQIAVGNPPYRSAGSGRLSPNEEKAVAKHEVSLPLKDFVCACSYLLTDRGRVGMIYHPGRLAELFSLFNRWGIAPSRLRSVHPRVDANAAMALVEGVKQGRNPLVIEKPLIIYQKGGQYTREVRNVFI